MGWGAGNLGGGSCGGLNFKVVGNPKPTSPKENTIWVNTDVDITGYHLSVTAPENPTAGMLWIKISDSSSIKVGTPLGKDYITIMLDSVSQYVGGAWVNVEAKSFQNGVWGNFVVYLFKTGEGAKVEFEIYKASKCTITQTSDAVTISYSAVTGGEGYWLTKDKYDLTGKKEIVFLAKCTQNYVGTDTVSRGYATMFVVASSKATGSGFLQNRVAECVLTEYGQTMEYAIDVAALDGSYYLGYSGIGNLTIYNVFVK